MGGVRLDWRVHAWSVSVRRGGRGEGRSAGGGQKSWQGGGREG